MRLLAVINQNKQKILLKTENIKLDQFLKMVNIATSGGQAKIWIEEGKVSVNEEIEKRRGRKIKSGDQVTIFNTSYQVE